VPADADIAISVRGLTKSYGSFEALRGIRPRGPPGRVLALLGPQRAGKTTAVEILEGYRTRDAGEVSVLGPRPGATGPLAWRARVGIVLQECAVDPLSDRDRGDHSSDPTCTTTRVRSTRVVALVGFGEKSRSRVKSCSGVSRRRLDSACPGRNSRADLPGRAHHRFRPVGPARGPWDVVRDLCAEAARWCSHPLHGRGPGTGGHRRRAGLRSDRGLGSPDNPGRAGPRGVDRPLRAAGGATVDDLPCPGGSPRRCTAGSSSSRAEPTAALHD